MQERNVLVGRYSAVGAAMALAAMSASAMPMEPPAPSRRTARKKNAEQPAYVANGRVKQGGRKHAKGRKFKGSKAAKRAARKRG